MKKLTILLSILISFIGCKTVRVDNAYRGHFNNQFDRVIIVNNSNVQDYPNEITESLPQEFQMAKMMGYLTLIIDGKGYLIKLQETQNKTQ